MDDEGQEPGPPNDAAAKSASQGVQETSPEMPRAKSLSNAVHIIIDSF